MPGLAGDDAAVANGLLVNEYTSGLLRFEADVFKAGHALASDEVSGSEYLGAMADSEDPLLLRVELPNKIKQTPIIAEVLRRAAAQNQDGIVALHLHLVEREVGRQTVARTLDVGIPAWLDVVDYEMESTN